MIYVHQETGRWLISKKAVDAQSELFKKRVEKIQPSKGMDENKQEKKNSNIRWITRNIVRNLPSVTYHYLRAYHFSFWLFLFFGLIRIRKKWIPCELFLASLVLFHLVSLSTFLPSTIRFSVPVIPLSLFWAGAGILEIKRMMEKIKISNPERVVLGLILIVILIQLPKSLTPERRHRAEQEKAGGRLKQNTPADAIIMSNSPQEVFYAERDWVPMPLGIPTSKHPGRSYKEIIQFGKEKKVGFIFIYKNIQETNPGFLESIHPADLKEIFRRTGQISILYEVIY